MNRTSVMGISSYDKDTARILGIPQALLLQSIHEAIVFFPEKHKDIKCDIRTTGSLASEFPELSRHTINKALDDLSSLGVLKIEFIQYVDDDVQNAYWIDHDKLNVLVPENEGSDTL